MEQKWQHATPTEDKIAMHDNERIRESDAKATMTRTTTEPACGADEGANLALEDVHRQRDREARRQQRHERKRHDKQRSAGEQKTSRLRHGRRPLDASDPESDCTKQKARTSAPPKISPRAASTTSSVASYGTSVCGGGDKQDEDWSEDEPNSDPDIDDGADEDNMSTKLPSDATPNCKTTRVDKKKQVMDMAPFAFIEEKANMKKEVDRCLAEGQGKKSVIFRLAFWYHLTTDACPPLVVFGSSQRCIGAHLDYY